uniref:Uncharacterized protein n=1 Tax=Timema cristinae TaxID=61476 RepID=A0A7R9H1A6_TIMCR|nr:unnamed protein product [Timema cristinae]
MFIKNTHFVFKTILRKFALDYATHHPTMGIGHPNCPLHPEDYFKDGVTNGGLWDSHEGSMMVGKLFYFSYLRLMIFLLGYALQDYSYLNTSTFQLDIYVSCERTPLRSHLPSVWIEHKKSLMSVLNWIDMGIKGMLLLLSCVCVCVKFVCKGYVVDDNGRPIANASIEVEGNNYFWKYHVIEHE